MAMWPWFPTFLDHVPEITALVVIPVLVLSLAFGIRRSRGQPSPAGLDFLLVITSVDFGLVVSPSPFVTLVERDWLAAFAAFYVVHGVSAIGVFVALLGVEDRIISHWLKSWLETRRARLPRELAHARFPLWRVILAWAIVAFAFASATIPFVVPFGG